MGRKREKHFDLAPRLHRKGRCYYYVTSTRPRRWINLGADKAQAQIEWARLDAQNRDSKKGTFDALVDRYLIDVLPDKAPATQREYKRQAEILRRVFGPMPLGAIRPTHIAQYLDEHRGKVSANREQSLMSAMFRKAMRWGWTDWNPCIGVERNAEKARDRYIEDEEFLRTKGKASPVMARIMEVAYVTSLRKNDILSIRLSEPPEDSPDRVFLREDGLFVRQSKTKNKQLFEMTPVLAEIIENAKSLRRGNRSDYLFCNRKGQRYTTAGFDANWKRLLKKAKVENFHFQDIRAKAATDADELGLDPQRLLGHKTRAMTDRYIKQRKVMKVKPLPTKL
jgi:integrase